MRDRVTTTDQDPEDFEELRGVRLQLDFLKAEIVLKRHGIEHTVVVFGSSRCAASSPYYVIARELGSAVSQLNRADSKDRWCVMTGAGPGIMEAANRGAADVGAPSVGLNIELPEPQTPNPYVTRELSFEFHYFAIRKLHLLLRAKALVVFPGGFGTLDELFEVLTLVQTRKITPLPIVLVAREFWRQAVNFEFLISQGVISHDDRQLIRYAESAAEILDIIRTFHHR
jgi:uncharacterized protein (TIGR00730 family)